MSLGVFQSPGRIVKGIDLMAEPLGEIEISEDVVANIAAHCAARTPGVVELSEGFVGGIGKLLRHGFPGQAEASKGVKVEMAEKSAVIDLSVAVREGHPIPTVAAALQRTVKEKVESMTGLQVERVNVFVRDIVSAIATTEEEAETTPPPAEALEEEEAEK
jgi:uncharacterized alkaline shock family protein YloU